MWKKDIEQAPHQELALPTLPWILNNSGASITIFGVALFVLFRAVYIIYYSRFNVTPEEVGLDYLGILTAQSSMGLIVIMVVILIFLFYRKMLIDNRRKIEINNNEVLMMSNKDSKSPKEVNEQIENSENEFDIARYRKFAKQQIIKFTIVLISIPISYFTIPIADVMKTSTEATEPTVSDFFQGRATPVIALWIDPPGEEKNSSPITYIDLGISNLGAKQPELLLLGNNGGIIVFI